MNILVLGHKGMLGNAVHKFLENKKITVLTTESRWPSKEFKSFIKECDCDFVINCAAETHVDNSIVNSSKFLQSNVSGVHNLLKLVKSKGNYQMPTFLHFSTDEVYGDIADGTHKETDILTPSNPYSATKAAADQLITAWGRTYGLPYIIVRPTNNYGIYQHTEKLIPKACKFITTGRKIPLHEKGTPIRNWLHAADTADAIITLVKGGSIQEIYNISGNFEQSNLETVKKILREFQFSIYSLNKISCII